MKHISPPSLFELGSHEIFLEFLGCFAFGIILRLSTKQTVIRSCRFLHLSCPREFQVCLFLRDKHKISKPATMPCSRGNEMDPDTPVQLQPLFELLLQLSVSLLSPVHGPPLSRSLSYSAGWQLDFLFLEHGLWLDLSYHIHSRQHWSYFFWPPDR